MSIFSNPRRRKTVEEIEEKLHQDHIRQITDDFVVRMAEITLEARGAVSRGAHEPFVKIVQICLGAIERDLGMKVDSWQSVKAAWPRISRLPNFVEGAGSKSFGEEKS